mgnify:CR=1 FL=1
MAYDLVIKNGTVIDGSGLPRYRADIGVRRGRIAMQVLGRLRQHKGGLLERQTLKALLLSCECQHGEHGVALRRCSRDQRL